MNKYDSKSLMPIQLENLSKVYRGKKGRKVQALDNVSLAVQQGEVFGFLGPNGAGKSTSIKALMGLIRPTSGQILLCGQPVSDVRSRQNVGYLPENPSFYEYLTGREYLRFVAGLFKIEAGKAATSIDEVLKRFSLTDAADNPLRSYSKGMVQRLGLAQALVHDPEIYVLDEPMSGLDPQGRALVKEIILERKARGKTVFFSTHITSDVEKICDRLAIIVNGRIQVIRSVDEIMRSGMTGYRVRSRGGEKLVDQYRGVHLSNGEIEIEVASSGLTDLIEKIDSAGATVELIEPVRHDLEEYFLSIVDKASA
jgi:ABC-2 type transport system ATP-binding protein